MVATFVALTLAAFAPLVQDTTSTFTDSTALPLSTSIGDTLADELTEPRGSGIAYERLFDAFRFDRVQGVSFGLGYRLELPGLAYTTLHGTARYGISDERLTGRLSVIRDAPGGRLRVSGYRDIRDVDPLAPGPNLRNTFNATFTAHDNGDYALATGGEVSYRTLLGETGLELEVSARAEREESVRRRASSAVNDWLGGDGEFSDNPPIDEGTFGGLTARLAGGDRIQWWIAADGLAGAGTATGRLYGEIRRDFGEADGVTLRAQGGIATVPTLAQMAFRAGGLATVRGFDYGTQRGQAFWSAQLDVAPIPARIRPVAFIDAGRSAAARDLFSGRVLVGAGIGLSLLRGALRFDLSRRLSPDVATLRFDIVVGGVR
ncbi:MAG TPA: hypothetical protein VFW66_08460 [Gemmatimonadales bacterium]|nr:hypothetical protein [Gemmatimonadales bacterium]